MQLQIGLAEFQAHVPESWILLQRGAKLERGFRIALRIEIRLPSTHVFRRVLARAGRSAHRNRKCHDETGSSSRTHLSSFTKQEAPEQK